MRTLVSAATVFCITVLANSVFAGDSPLNFTPLVNEISVYQNVADDGDDLGQTLQIISINAFDILTDFSIEFTADFNRNMTPGEDQDYYLEFSIVKPVWEKMSVNYQRIHGTFMAEPVNQLGVRWSF